jgi:predicted tellurium resistance membrane protein TerC
MLELLTEPATWASLATLTVMEVVLGIDNVVFISILAGKLPADEQNRARLYGLALAAVSRLLLLLTISWLMGLVEPLFEVFGRGFSGRDLILLGGGLFLIYKATREIHEKLEGSEEEEASANRGKRPKFLSVILQIAVLDIVFSLDSVITAVGMADHLEIMMAAVLIALIVMVVLVNPISNFVMRHPTVKMLALSFLLLIGFTLVVESLQVHIEKGYIYSAMAFSLFVEMLNLWRRSRAERRGSKQTSEPVQLRQNVVGLNVGAEATKAE